MWQPFAKLVNDRYACKEWKEDIEVPKSIIRRCLKLAGRAPSCLNTQPYKFIVVMSKEGKLRLANAMHGPNPGHVLKSSFSVVVAADPDPIPLLPKDAPPFAAQVLQEVSLAQSTPEAWAGKNATLAAGDLLLAFTAAGLQTNPMEGFVSKDAVRQAVGLPEKYDVPLVVAVGYAKNPPPPQSSRRPVEEMCCLDHFGQPFTRSRL